MKIAVVLVNYNGKQYNVSCIDSLFGSQGNYQMKIYVTDNHSSDDSMQIIADKYRDCEALELIYMKENTGFAAANNEGIRRAKEWGAEFILLLNNDTVVDSCMLTKLMECADRHPGSVIVPKIYYYDKKNTIWAAGGSVSPILHKVHHNGLDEEDCGQYDRETVVPFGTGCCMLIPSGVIEKAGLLREEFFLYYEDTEYCFRLQAAGILLFYCPEAFLYHKVGASSKGQDSALCAYYIARNWLLCNRIHMEKSRFLLFLVYYTVNRIVCCFLWLIKGRADLVRATVRGIADFIRGKMGRSNYY